MNYKSLQKLGCSPSKIGSLSPPPPTCKLLHFMSFNEDRTDLLGIPPFSANSCVRRVTELNVERRRKGPRINQNWYYHEAETWLKSRSSLWKTKERDVLRTVFHTRILALLLFENFTVDVRRCSRWNGAILSNVLSFIKLYSCWTTILSLHSTLELALRLP